MRTRISAFAAAAASLAVGVPVARSDQSFTLLPHAPGMTRSASTGISGDGRTVVGVSHFGTGSYAPSKAFRWTAGGGLSVLPMPDGTYRASASAVSNDGSVITGTFSREILPFEVPEAYRWSAGDGTSILPTLSNATNPHRTGLGVSGDGRLVVGQGRNNVNKARAVYWDGVSTPVAFLPGILGSGQASRASADGSVLGGTTGYGIFRWSASEGYRGVPPKDEWYSVELGGMSDNGEVIAANARGYGFRLAYRWTQETGYVTLPLFANWKNSRATDVTPGGNVIVGELLPESENPGQAFYWSQTTGTVYLRSLLYPSVPDDWTLIRATGVSDDGLTVTGVATRNGEVRAFVATIPATPSLALLGVAGVCSRRRAR
ncbi:MAG: hypothetical protein GIKADHBN_00520 [Phycisphaerales bacterium]|nr:hypothetical protein [Phycisphaerales bacterium]